MRNVCEKNQQLGNTHYNYTLNWTLYNNHICILYPMCN